MKILLKSTALFAKTNKSNHWLIHHHFCCLFQPRIKKDCKFIWWPFAGLGLTMNIIKFILQNLCQSSNIGSWVCNTVVLSVGLLTWDCCCSIFFPGWRRRVESEWSRVTAETIRGDDRRKKCCSRSAVCWKQPSLFPVTNNMIRFPRDGGFVSKNLLNWIKH